MVQALEANHTADLRWQVALRRCTADSRNLPGLRAEERPFDRRGPEEGPQNVPEMVMVQAPAFDPREVAKEARGEAARNGLSNPK
jgi:hypothetical protein